MLNIGTMPFNETIMAVLLIVLVSTLIRSTFGFGDALTSMPLLALFISLAVAAPLVALVSFTISISILVRCWREIVVSSTWRLIAASFLGIPLGLLYLRGSYENILKVILALVILTFSVYILLKPKILRLKTEKTCFLFGFAAGILGGAYNTTGPPVVIYGTMRNWTPASFRATLQGYFLVTGIVIMLGHWSSGLWTSEMFGLYALCFPLIILSLIIGSWLHERIPEGKFDRYVYYLLIAVGIILLAQTIWQMQVQ